MYIKANLILAFLIMTQVIVAQPERWQQRVDYRMNIDFDASKHQFKGQQKLIYFNQSPDELDKVFYHLYFNAFQPGSVMDVRSLNIPDPDPRVGNRISLLKPNEIGYIKITKLLHNGIPVKFEENGTILEVTLDKPIQSMNRDTFDMEFEAQVPKQIRRSGRDNKEGIDYSMAQWYPKMCEYDYQGWHANPYIGREFYGVWGDFDVTINIDRNYCVAATGFLMNPEEIGYGYESQKPIIQKNGAMLSWHFEAANVHDFVWAADKDFKHDIKRCDDGSVMHFFYVPGKITTENWSKLPDIMSKAYTFMCDHFGKYPYKSYSFIQGGDGGMEYPMATLVTGERILNSLVGVCVHEWAHSWYQGVIGTNESLYPWMDEGFTSYAENQVINHLKKEKIISGEETDNVMLDDVNAYLKYAASGTEQPLSTHADHFDLNRSYGISSYTKGAVFLEQLAYIMGQKNLDAGLLKYFNTWKFKHPNANDCIRIMEKQSGLELDWFKEYFVQTTYTADYGIQNFENNNITLKNVGHMPMPIELTVTYEDNTKEMFYIPLDIMRGEKNNDNPNLKRTTLQDWNWVNPTYTFKLSSTKKVTYLEIDESHRMADANRVDNVLKPIDYK